MKKRARPSKAPPRRTSGTAKQRRSQTDMSRDGAAKLAGGIAHDLNNLLTVVRNATALLKSELDEDAPTQRYVEQLLVAGNRMAQVARQLQAFGRGQVMRPEDVRPDELIRRVSTTLRHVLPETLDFRVSIRACGLVHVDPVQLERAVVRILMYLADAIGNGGRIWLAAANTARGDTTLDGAAVGAHVRISISSTAPAPERTELQRLFEPAFSHRRGATGSDLRLASARGIVRQAGGRIEASQERGRGFGFHIYLPIIERQARPGLELVAPTPDSLAGDEVILVVEDDADVRRTVCESLEHYGYSVFEADDGTSALRLSALLSAPPDLLLTDIVMPEVNGRELIEVLRTEGVLPRVLLMSGYTDEMLERSMPDAVYPFIAKPFTYDELGVRVREVLDAPLQRS